MRRAVRLALLAPIALGAGCVSYLQPGAPTPIPALASRATADGGRLRVDARGALVHAPAAGDLRGVFGLDLAAEAEQVVVRGVEPPPARADAGAPEPGAGGPAEVQAPEGPRPGDVVVLAQARRLPPPAAGAPDAAVAALEGTLDPDAALPLTGQAGVAPRAPADLRGFAVGLDDLVLRLVVRRAGALLAVAARARPPEPLPVVPWDREAEARLGFTLARVDAWPPGRRPADAGPADLLVVAVEAGSVAARAGLRPLDLLRGGPRSALELLRTDAADLRAALEDDPALREKVLARIEPLTAVGPGGAAREVALELPPPAAEWGFPLLVGRERTGWRTRFGLGPFDLLFHASSEARYDALADDVVVARRWSLLTLLQVVWQEGPGRAGLQVRLDPLVDAARGAYLEARLGAGAE